MSAFRTEGLHGDEVIWRRGKMLPDGRFRELTLTKEAAEGLVDAFGEEWLERYLAEAEAELEKWGVN